MNPHQITFKKVLTRVLRTLLRLPRILGQVMRGIVDAPTRALTADSPLDHWDRTADRVSRTAGTVTANLQRTAAAQKSADLPAA